jgi:two-component system sensor histidine kinase KdpD
MFAKRRTKPAEGDNRVIPFGDEDESFFRTEFLPLAMALAGVVLITAPLLMVDRKVAAALVPVAYLIPVTVAATQWGIWPATLASIASMAAADFFFFPPIFSFQVESPEEVIDLLLFLVVSLVSSNLASRLKRETDTLRRREKEMHKLYEFSQRLAACFTIGDLVSAIQNYLSRNLGPQAAFFVATPDSHFEPPKTQNTPKAVLDAVAQMAAAAGAVGRTIVDFATQEIWLLRAVSSETIVHGVIAINIGTGSAGSLKARAAGVEAIVEEVSLTLQRLDIGKAMEDARLHLQAQLLRDAFHGTLSHELCSPLAAIQGSASVLASVPLVERDAQARSLVEAISEEVTQLDGYIQNLLQATRVTAGGLKPRLEWTDPRDIADAAIRRTARRLAAHKVVSVLDADLPLVNVDSGLIEEACGQLLQNAAKYSPSGSTISIKLHADPGWVVLSVTDEGVGITADEQQELGRRSFRSDRLQASVPGSGLGFWIASTFVKANGGAITVSSRGQGMGTTASIALPASQSTFSELTALDNE